MLLTCVEEAIRAGLINIPVLRCFFSKAQDCADYCSMGSCRHFAWQQSSGPNVRFGLRVQPASIMFPNGADRYELSARDFGAMQVQLNGEVLKLRTADELPALKPIHVSAGAVELQPTSISFFAVLNANNPSCREG